MVRFDSSHRKRINAMKRELVARENKPTEPGGTPMSPSPVEDSPLSVPEPHIMRGLDDSTRIVLLMRLVHKRMLTPEEAVELYLVV